MVTSSFSSPPSTSTLPTLPSAGCLPDEDYVRILGPWRSNARRILVNSLKKEMKALEWIQSFRTPARDFYFVNSSLLGTHTAFATGVPMLFWFGGYGSTGRGLLYTLAAGGYITSVLKDLFCVPRPYAPPLVRLAVGNHALEYGFPSTHSTNSVSMALYFAAILWRGSIGELGVIKIFELIGLAIVALTVVWSRLYCGMHSMMDVAVGSIIGALVWYMWYIFEDVIELWTLTPGWQVTMTFIPFTLFLVFYHPAPAEDCPCFEDAVAFVSVFAGILVGRNWYQVEFIEETVRWSNDEGVVGILLLSLAIVVKLIIGVAAIFTWRLFAKKACQAVLPSIVRLFSSSRSLNLNPYTFSSSSALPPPPPIQPTLQKVPSLLDIPTLNSSLESSTSTGSNTRAASKAAKEGAVSRRFRSGSLNAEPVDLRFRAQAAAVAESVEGNESNKEEDKQMNRKIEQEEREKVIKRDADVWTKVLVYAGIGWNASIGIPLLLKYIGLNV